MFAALKLKAALAAVVSAPLLALSPADIPLGAVGGDGDFVAIAAGTVSYRPAGDFSRNGRPANPPMRHIGVDRAITIMKRQVTAGEYQRCVDAGACAVLTGSTPADHPVVGVSWRDATAYAAWLSSVTGDRFRLPTDEEWAFAAGSRLRDDALPEGGTNDPSRRWLARYEAEASRDKIAKATQPVGTFGTNEHGLVDLAGNVWEWTDTCFVRGAIETDDEIRTTLTNCGVRVVEGAHRTYVTDFIRDARAGGCAVGTPPANLGFRLMREDDAWRPLRRLLAWARPSNA